MVDLEYVVSNLSRMVEDTGLLQTTVIKAVEIVVLAIITLVLLGAAKGFFRGLVRAKVLDPGSLSYVYPFTRNLILLAALLVAVYILTGSRFLLILATVGAAAVLLSSWDALANLISYYVILGSRMVSKDEYIVLPNGIHGKVKDIRPFYILLENRYGYYMVPNTQIVRSGKLSRKELSYFRLSVRLWGLTDQPYIERIKVMIAEEVEQALRELAYGSMASHSILVDEISEDSITLRIIFSTQDPEPKPEKVSQLIMELSSRLRSKGISHSITFEEPEGYEQRWAAVE